MVAAHKKFPMPKDTDLYMPILVGATKNYKPDINYQRDDVGENISIKNPNYNELTAVYWAWKNLDADVIGLVHYRRMFSLHRKRNLDSILEKKEIETLLRKAPIILPKKRNYYIETNYSHYIHAHHEEPLEVTRQVLAEKYPNFVVFFDRSMKSRSSHMFNMFIMKKKEFDIYSSWLFTILFEVEKRIDISNYSLQEKRVFGYLAEILLDVWIEQGKYKYVEINWIQLGARKLLSKTISFVLRKFGKKKITTHF